MLKLNLSLAERVNDYPPVSQTLEQYGGVGRRSCYYITLIVYCTLFTVKFFNSSAKENTKHDSSTSAADRTDWSKSKSVCLPTMLLETHQVHVNCVLMEMLSSNMWLNKINGASARWRLGEVTVTVSLFRLWKKRGRHFFKSNTSIFTQWPHCGCMRRDVSAYTGLMESGAVGRWSKVCPQIDAVHQQASCSPQT